MFLATLWRGYQLGHPLILAIGAVSLVAFTFVLSMADLGWIMALIFSMLTTGVVGVAIDRIAYRPLRGAPRLSLLITAIAVSIFLQNFGLLTFSQRQTPRSEEHTSELQSRGHLVCRLLLEKKKQRTLHPCPLCRH